MRTKALLEGHRSLCLIGLGYVGVPLLASFSDIIKVVGVDTDEAKINSLNQGIDPNQEFASDSFNLDNIKLCSNLNEVLNCDTYIVTVPTPITKNKTPNLSPLKSASKSIGQKLKKGDLVIFESTVYPGCTEEVCIPILEQESNLEFQKDFNVGYSPERINPGDKVHRLDNTIKIVSGDNPDTLLEVSEIYRLIINAGVHKADSIKVAEAAKIVENVQRDVNIALMNELALIFDRIGINTNSVLEAASTKWNFHRYSPGLVGGHCISVDPYYLTYKAQELGYFPNVILSGREVNNRISRFLSNKIVQHIGKFGLSLSEARVLIKGVTFKENVSDLRNSKVIDLINHLLSYSIHVDVVDPWANAAELNKNYGIKLASTPSGKYDCIVVSVKHKQFLELDELYYSNILKPDGLLFDVKNQYSGKLKNIAVWSF